MEAYAKEQGLWHDPSHEIKFSEYLELDLSTVVPSISGPKRPQDRIMLTEAKDQFRQDLRNYVKHDVDAGSLDESLDESFPASDSPSFTQPTRTSRTRTASRRLRAAHGADGRPSNAGQASRPKTAASSSWTTAQCRSPRSRPAPTRPTRP